MVSNFVIDGTNRYDAVNKIICICQKHHSFDIDMFNFKATHFGCLGF